METVRIEFGKDKTLIIKGVAICMMILLHVFGGAGWYDNSIPMNSNTQLLKYMNSCSICVPIYLFMVGYGYAFSKRKDFTYSFIHIKRLLSVFWLILFCFSVPVSLNSIHDGKELILNMFGLKETICWVSWFVYVYIWAMVIMPFFGRLIDRNVLLWTPLSIIIFYLGEVIIHEYLPYQTDNWFIHSIFTCFTVSPVIVLGYSFAKTNLFQRVRVPNKLSVGIGALVLSLFVLFFRVTFPSSIFGFGLGFFWAPCFIFLILVISSIFNNVYIKKILCELGDKSVYMWFIHSLFFTAATRYFYGPLVIFSQNLWIIGLWTIVFSYIVSVGLKKIMDF